MGPQISPFHRSGLRGPSYSLAFKLKCNCVLSRIKPPACWERSTCQPGWWYCEDTDAAQCPWNSMHFHVNGTAQDLYLNSDLFMLTRGHENACTLLILGQLRTCKTFWFFWGPLPTTQYTAAPFSSCFFLPSYSSLEDSFSELSFFLCQHTIIYICQSWAEKSLAKCRPYIGTQFVKVFSHYH